MYKGVLTDWNNVPVQRVAIKTLKGTPIEIYMKLDTNETFLQYNVVIMEFGSHARFIFAVPYI